PAQPDLTPAPATLDFSSTNNVPGGVDYTTLAPALKQVFFIGDGQTSGGQKQRVIVPAGATRLYLGTMDGFEWTNNHGNLTIQVFAETNERGLAVRRDFVPNEWNNDAFTEQSGHDDQGVTLVPPALSDGTFFITVYGNSPYNCTLFNGDPLIRDVD